MEAHVVLTIEFVLLSCKQLTNTLIPRYLSCSLYKLLQRIMRLGFDWDTNEMSIMLLAKLAMPFTGTARIVINSIHIKGDVCVVVS